MKSRGNAEAPYSDAEDDAAPPCTSLRSQMMPWNWLILQLRNKWWLQSVMLTVCVNDSWIYITKITPGVLICLWLSLLQHQKRRSVKMKHMFCCALFPAGPQKLRSRQSRIFTSIIHLQDLGGWDLINIIRFCSV